MNQVFFPNENRYRGVLEMDYARASLLLREWEMNDVGSLARVSLTP
jgi:hypothetical protein